MKKRTVKYKILECNQNERMFYISVLPNDVLKQICFVARRDEDPQKGFQRTLNKSRANDIAKYLDEIKGTIPSALILSAQENARLKINNKNNEISFVLNENSFMVLDGQHRLYGLVLAKKIYKIPVIIFNKLTTAEEVNLFIDINTTQKGVPTTLLLDIKNLTGKETKKEDRQRHLFDQLNKDSVLAGLMSPAKSQVGKITRVSFNLATNDLFDRGFFQNKDNDAIFKGVKNYLEASEVILKRSKSEKAKLTNSIFFRALFAIFNDIIDKSLNDYGDLKVESLINNLDPISRINFDSYVGTSNTTLGKVVADMRTELNSYKKHYDKIKVSDLF